MNFPSVAHSPVSFAVIGAGHAGVEMAFQLRRNGASGRILLIDEGEHAPYHRPPLSKNYLLAASDAPAALLRPMQSYLDNRIELLLHSQVRAIDRSRGRIMLSNADSVEYETLILATGASARPLTAASAAEAIESHAIHHLRTLDDAQRLRSVLQPGTTLAIIGAGYIGLEVAASAAAAGVQVHVVERQLQLLARSASAELAEHVLTVHQARGVKFHLGVDLQGIQMQADGQGVVLQLENAAHECAVQADQVLVGIGAIPNTHLAEAAGLSVANGVLVDEHMQTDDSQIYAIGDCAAIRNPQPGWPVRLESIPVALAQAQALAARLCGKPAVPPTVPWFWSDQHDMKIQMAGHRIHDELIVRSDPVARSLTRLYLAQGQLIGVECVNNPKEFMQARKSIGSGELMDAALRA